MPTVPAAIVQRLKQKYPKPSVDSAWLQSCYDWVIDEFGLANGSTEDVFDQVDLQFLSSDLTDSTVPETGLPSNVSDFKNDRIATRASGGAILCQVAAITDIGNSAFSLRNVRQTRIDKADMAGLAEEAEGGQGPPPDREDFVVPSYPRSMLRMVLSDGSRTLEAMEYRSLPALQLGVTPLGIKILLSDVMVRRGIAFLEPKNVTIFEGSRVDELNANQDLLFSRGLRVRMGLPEIDPEEEEMQQARTPSPIPAAPPVQAPQPLGPGPAPAPAPVPNSSISSAAKTEAKTKRLQAIQQTLEHPRRPENPFASSSPYFSEKTTSGRSSQGVIGRLQLEPVHMGGRPPTLRMSSPPPSLQPEDEDAFMMEAENESFDFDDFQLDEADLQEIENIENKALSQSALTKPSSRRTEQPRIRGDSSPRPSAVPSRPLDAVGTRNRDPAPRAQVINLMDSDEEFRPPPSSQRSQSQRRATSRPIHSQRRTQQLSDPDVIDISD